MSSKTLNQCSLTHVILYSTVNYSLLSLADLHQRY
uniref:Uncharacterized protein n=1 Tax=Anguilla anguilla TaxID=7936 RepID=A0A0E9UAE7_ANGAN